LRFSISGSVASIGRRGHCSEEPYLFPDGRSGGPNRQIPRRGCSWVTSRGFLLAPFGPLLQRARELQWLSCGKDFLWMDGPCAIRLSSADDAPYLAHP